VTPDRPNVLDAKDDPQIVCDATERAAHPSRETAFWKKVCSRHIR